VREERRKLRHQVLTAAAEAGKFFAFEQIKRNNRKKIILSTHMPVPERRIKSLIMKKLATKKHNNHNKDVNNDMIHMTVILPLILLEMVLLLPLPFVMMMMMKSFFLSSNEINALYNSDTHFLEYISSSFFVFFLHFWIFKFERYMTHAITLSALKMRS